MSVIFMRELDHLKEVILRLAVSVEDRLHKAIRAVESRDGDLARQIVERDNEVDAQEVRIEEECLKILALHQPVASDLRFVVFVLKIDNDLERIGDMAVNIAKRVPVLLNETATGLEGRLAETADLAFGMLRNILEAFVNLDTAAAAEVCAQDDSVDALHRATSEAVLQAIQSGKPGCSPKALMTVLGISKELERVADHVTSIAEDLMYLVDGSIVRHRVQEYMESHPSSVQGGSVDG